MTTELTLLGWTLVVALGQIFAAAMVRTGETGLDYNAGARDRPAPPEGVLAGRLRRAQANLFETLPLFAAAVLIAHVAGRNGTETFWGVWLYFLARIAYVPLYGVGVPYLRSIVWLVGIIGLALILFAILRPV
ncbi:MAPEG family protein [Ancylobacter oerskovii]|uniref:MAPEG family protein n=1 Tax=Ancylobacter oerskovii TaxID=459519 RepID=A0ABW4YRL3_9HYPH|nr:MAPEG family protein [Ancylobacter oerskovii]MBS7545576.1 MAPEG family protein [Ancylobacter oerskovii]